MKTSVLRFRSQAVKLNSMRYRQISQLFRATSPVVLASATLGALMFTLSAAAATPFERGTMSPDHLRLVWSLPGCHCLLGAQRNAPSAPWGAPAKLFEIRGGVEHLVFSPDGRRVAFENTRGDLTVNNKGDVSLNGFDPAKSYSWSFIATYDFKTGRIDYVDPTFADDRAPSWSTSGREISFTRYIDGQGAKPLTRKAPVVDAKTPGTPQRGSLGSILAAPVVFQPAASSDGRVFVYGARGGRTRGIYLKADRQPARRLVSYGDDDGQELGDMALSPKGDILAYVRGGFPNKTGDIPNPRSLRIKPQREVWIMGTGAAQAPLKVAAGGEPQFTPDGASLVWIDPEGLMMAPLVWNASRFSGVGPTSKVIGGKVSEVRFSPKGDRLLYTRGDGVGVYDLARDRTWLIDRPRDAVDTAAIWSPDGERIAFIRTTGPQPKRIRDGLLGNAGPFTSATPWKIMAADVGASAVSQVWQANSGKGSAYFALDEDPTGVGHPGGQLFWAAGGKIVFEWEPDGWRHLYAVPDTGGEAKLLTPGDGEVETAALSLDGRYMFAASNIGDLGRRHLSRVEISTGVAAPVTGGEASQWAPTALADGALAFVEAGWADPPAVKIWRPEGGFTSAGLPAVLPSFPRDLLVRPELVEVAATDGSKAFGQLFRPRHPTGCGVVFAHGGIQRQMLPGFHYMEGYSNLYEINQYLASRGCAVLSIEYRSSIMRGYDFRNAAGWGSAGASEMADVVGAANALKSDPSLKVRRVGIYGLSWGGYITSQALARYPDVFAAGFDIAGVHEFFGERTNYGPVASVKNWRSPVFLVQGDDDRNVDFYQGASLAKALNARPDVDAVLRAVPDETHDLNLTFEHLEGAYGEGVQFLLDHLTDKAASGAPPS